MASERETHWNQLHSPFIGHVPSNLSFALLYIRISAHQTQKFAMSIEERTEKMKWTYPVSRHCQVPVVFCRCRRSRPDSRWDLRRASSILSTPNSPNTDPFRPVRTHPVQSIHVNSTFLRSSRTSRNTIITPFHNMNAFKTLTSSSAMFIVVL